MEGNLGQEGDRVVREIQIGEEQPENAHLFRGGSQHRNRLAVEEIGEERFQKLVAVYQSSQKPQLTDRVRRPAQDQNKLGRHFDSGREPSEGKGTEEGVGQEQEELRVAEGQGGQAFQERKGQRGLPEVEEEIQALHPQGRINGRQ